MYLWEDVKMRILEREGSSDRHFRDPVRPHMISVRQKILERVSFHPHLTFVQPQLHDIVCVHV